MSMLPSQKPRLRGSDSRSTLGHKKKLHVQAVKLKLTDAPMLPHTSGKSVATRQASGKSTSARTATFTPRLTELPRQTSFDKPPLVPNTPSRDLWNSPMSRHLRATRASRITRSAPSSQRLAMPQTSSDAQTFAASTSPIGDTLTGATDPRWVLARRAAEQLEGAILRPVQREKILRTGKLLGLTDFDASLIIAIVQDQARRGHQPQYCAAAGKSQLEMIRLPSSTRAQKSQRWIAIASLTICLLAFEAILVMQFFR